MLLRGDEFALLLPETGYEQAGSYPKSSKAPFEYDAEEQMACNV